MCMKRQATLYLHLILCLGLAWANAFFYKILLYGKFCDISDILLASASISLAYIMFHKICILISNLE